MGTSVSTEALNQGNVPLSGKCVSYCLMDNYAFGREHTAANTANWIEKVIAHGDNVIAVTKVLYAKHGQEPMACMTLNLVVQNCLKSQQAISRCVGAARTLVEDEQK